MTWWTEAGNVVPPRPVIDLLVDAAMGLRDEIMDEIRHEDPGLRPETGVPAFDDLDPRTRIFALAHVLKHLSDPNLESPDLYAWNEGTLWALFKRVEIDLALEIDLEASGQDDGEKYGTRKLVLEALASYGQSVKRYSRRSRYVRLWCDHLEMIYTHLFWDMDCLDDEIFGDLEPGRAEALKDELGIDPDYFSTPPPLVREEDFLEADAYHQAGWRVWSTPMRTRGRLDGASPIVLRLLPLSKRVPEHAIGHDREASLDGQLNKS